MTELYLRQIFVVVENIEKTLFDLRITMNTGVKHVDPYVEHFGARNAIIGMGNQYIELLEPIRESPIRRHLQRRGEGLYGVILQCFDDSEIVNAGKRLKLEIIHQINEPGYRATQYHPRDMKTSAILEIDQQDGAPEGRYFPVGNQLPSVRDRTVGSISELSVPSRRPQEANKIWQELLARPGTENGIEVENATIKFTQSETAKLTIQVPRTIRVGKSSGGHLDGGRDETKTIAGLDFSFYESELESHPGASE